MEQRQLLIGVEARFRRHELENVNAGQCPAMASDDGAQFALAFRQRDVKTALPLTNAFQQKLERQGGLPGAWAPFDQIDPIGVEAAAQDIVEPDAAGRDCLQFGIAGGCGFGHGYPLVNIRWMELVQFPQDNLTLKGKGAP